VTGAILMAPMIVFRQERMQRYEWAFTFRYQPGEGEEL
jgi:hypothetical protein